MSPEKLLKKLMENNKNVGFRDMVVLISHYGFHLSRISGSHHIFINPDVREIVNIQNVSGQVKPYQVKQFLKLVEKYNLQAQAQEDE